MFRRSPKDTQYWVEYSSDGVRLFLADDMRGDSTFPPCRYYFSVGRMRIVGNNISIAGLDPEHDVPSCWKYMASKDALLYPVSSN